MSEQAQSHHAITNVTIKTFATLTEYAPEQLDTTSHLENDFGIDSIALAEVMAALTKEFALETPLTTQGVETISDVIGKLSALGVQIAAQNAKETSSVDVDWLKSQVYEVVSEFSGYATSDLNDHAEIESDLGIDSITIVSAQGELLKRLNLPESTTLATAKTLAELHATLDALVKSHHGDAWQFEGGAHANNAEAATEESNEEKVHTIEVGDGDTRTMRDFVGLQHPDLFHKAREFKTFYERKKEQQLFWYGMPLETPCKNRAVIFDETTGQSREFLMFGSNSYLGLSNHPEVIAAIQDAAGSFGATNTGCRIIAGSNVLHLELERKLAKLKGREGCIVYPSGYSANLGCISALTGKNDIVFTDAINHMSIQDGIKLSGAQRKIYNHSLTSLEKSLAKYADHPGGKLIVTDGVFSMHGDVVDLPRLMKLAERYGARVLVDDAHSTGVLGKTGSGTTEHFNMKGQVDIELGTMSKALSGLGGFVCADGDVVDFLRFYSNSYVFAATIPAHVAAGVIASIDIMLREPERLTQLWDNIYYFRTMLLQAGFDLENSDSAIVPIVVGDDAKTLAFGRAVRARGMYCQTVVFPGVSVGDARLRISITSEHTKQDLDEAYAILVEAALEVGVPISFGSANSHQLKA
ncbi:aminotransferase class I/II-fold pyridoxal phosphate-dependent enzyme [Pseudoalteromonas xiamenensis]|uniref:aminotransferase class I/II-fold pyridoxal phosphate-dependent enzyme n=1 Tax=Pseudoalteromonas xiamenensis TaxID=882626 RepID=UPI0035E91BC1